MKNLAFSLRRWLIKKLIGNCAVLANVDCYGTVHMKGPWLLEHNVVSFPDQVYLGKITA